MYDWETSLSNFSKDISKYLKKRYADYCRDRNEVENKDMMYNHPSVKERHVYMKDQLIKFGTTLRKKLNFFLDESRKELFEQIDLKHKHMDSFYKSKIDDYCNKLDKILLVHPNQLEEIRNKKDKEKMRLFNRKEKMKSNLFVEIIDKRRTEYEMKVLEYKKDKAEEKIIRERTERRKGFSNVKPLSFYEEMYVYNEDESKYSNEDDNKSYIEEQQEKDRYFQEHGMPKGEWIKSDIKEEVYIEDNFIDKCPEVVIHISADSPEENQKHLNRCKEMKEIIEDLLSQDYMEPFKWIQDEKMFEIETLQKYLTKGYLITIQIASLVFRISYWLIHLLSIDLNKPHPFIENHPASEYKFNIYNDNYDIKKIREDVAEFARINEGMILTPLEHLKVYLKKHDNKITIKEYQVLEDKTNIVARRILNNFVKDKKLKKPIKIGKNHELVYSY